MLVLGSNLSKDCHKLIVNSNFSSEKNAPAFQNYRKMKFAFKKTVLNPLKEKSSNAKPIINLSMPFIMGLGNNPLHNLLDRVTFSDAKIPYLSLYKTNKPLDL